MKAKDEEGIHWLFGTNFEFFRGSLRFSFGKKEKLIFTLGCPQSAIASNEKMNFNKFYWCFFRVIIARGIA